ARRLRARAPARHRRRIRRPDQPSSGRRRLLRTSVRQRATPTPDLASAGRPATSVSHMQPTRDRMQPIAHGLNLAWRTVQPIADGLDLAWRTMQPIADGLDLTWRTVNATRHGIQPIAHGLNLTRRTVNAIARGLNLIGRTVN